jgi:hypothetical protein
MAEDDHVKSTTTSEEDLHSASQRGINATWENTQRQATLMILGTTCVGVLAGFFKESSILPAEWWGWWWDFISVAQITRRSAA